MLDTLAVHFIDLVRFSFGSASIVSRQATNGAKSGPGPDTVNVNLQHESGMFSSVFASYAAPYQLCVHATGTNGLVRIDGSELKIFSPRDTFDHQGLFSAPPKNQHEIYNFESDYLYSLENSLEFFFNSINDCDQVFLEHFDLSISTMRELLEIHPIPNCV